KAERKLKQAIGKLEAQISANKYLIKLIENRIDALEDKILDFPYEKLEYEKSIEKQQKKLLVEIKEITKLKEKINNLKAPETTSKVKNNLMNAFQFNNFDLMTVNLFILKIDVNKDKTLEIH